MAKIIPSFEASGGSRGAPGAKGAFKAGLGWLRWLLLLPFLFLGIAIVEGSYFTIAPEQIGMVLRFGKKHRIAEPGLHFCLPLGIEVIHKVPIRRQLKMEFGFRSVNQGNARTTYIDHNQNRDLLQESLMVTGDLNAAVVEWIVQYRIQDPYQYLFDVRDPERTFHDASESIMREVVGDHTVDEVLTVGRQSVADSAMEGLQKLVDAYKMGIRIEQIVLQDVNPPDEVKASFNEVNQSQQERERLINMAHADYNQVVPRAKGEAQQRIQEAEGYAMERVNHAQGEAARFNALFAEYQKAPDVTKRRMYLETLEVVLPRISTKYIIDEKIQGVTPFLSLGRESSPTPPSVLSPSSSKKVDK